MGVELGAGFAPSVKLDVATEHIVRFKSPLSLEEVMKVVEERAPEFRALAVLKQSFSVAPRFPSFSRPMTARFPSSTPLAAIGLALHFVPTG